VIPLTFATSRTIWAKVAGYLARKYNVTTAIELDELMQSGQIHEPEAFEDYFEFDHLEAERDVLLGSLKELA
jgi:hypothetical protein